ncbi:hypothetical protein [Granulicella rosea]|uniref:hypothetical protein n=1 Tax=Granulicella rosea TaxID=474952 RepID=UPI00115E14EA|nr:hypothetical protein [Granulicella rosea]
MTVAIVVDPHYSGLKELTAEMPVWIIDTPFNRALAESSWQPGQVADAFGGVTLYKVSSPDAAERNGIGILDMVDLHHGVYSSGMPISTLKVIGTGLSPVFQAALREYDFVSFEETAFGFLAYTEPGGHQSAQNS